MKKQPPFNITPAALVAAINGDMENAALAATPGGIEAQEKAGQALLVASSNMPKELKPGREAFEKIGFQFGNEVDDIFMSAKLPPGWKRIASEHSMHSDIFDEQGRRRVGVFYKAAFYDRRASAYLRSRYSLGSIYSDDPGSCIAEDEIIITVMDDDKEIHRFPVCKSVEYEGSRKVAWQWLKERFPDAEDPTAYW